MALSDNDFRTLSSGLEDLLGTACPSPRKDRCNGCVRDMLKRNGLGHCFPNKAERQRDYDRGDTCRSCCDEEAAP